MFNAISSCSLGVDAPASTQQRRIASSIILLAFKIVLLRSMMTSIKINKKMPPNTAKAVFIFFPPSVSSTAADHGASSRGAAPWLKAACSPGRPFPRSSPCCRRKARTLARDLSGRPSATTGRAREHIRSRAQDRRIMAAGYHAAGGWGNGLGGDGWRKERRGVRGK